MNLNDLLSLTSFFDVVATDSLRHWGREKIGRHSPDDIFKCISLNENIWILIKMSLKFVPKVPTSSNPALVQIMASRRLGAKPYSEPMLVTLLKHIYVTRPHWVKQCTHRCLSVRLQHLTHWGYCSLHRNNRGAAVKRHFGRQHSLPWVSTSKHVRSPAYEL